MTVCVCGHDLDAHRLTVMSVPLRGLAHYRERTTIQGNTVTATSINATYTRSECACGCTAYLPDTGRD